MLKKTVCDIRVFHINTKWPMLSILATKVFTAAKKLLPVGLTGSRVSYSSDIVSKF